MNFPKSSGRRFSRYSFSCSADISSRRLRERLRRRLAFLEEQRREQALLREDRRLESQRDRDAVRRPRVDVHGLGLRGDVQLRVERAVLDLRDVDAAQRAAHADDEILAEVVRERALALELVHLDHDRLGLRLADPDRQQPRAALLLQDHDVGVGRAVETRAASLRLRRVALNQIKRRRADQRRQLSAQI